LTSSFQSHTQRKNQQFQLILEREKRKNEKAEKERTLALDRLATAHRLLSIINREFSRATINIIGNADMKDLEYDQRYLRICQEVDELRVIACLYETLPIKDVEKIHDHMSDFWGNFRNVLRLNSLGEKVPQNISGLDNAYAAAREIKEKTTSLKHELFKLAKQYQIDD
jgi:hypothetical protein